MFTIAFKVGAAVAALVLLERLTKVNGTIELAFDYQTCKCSRVEYLPDGRINRIEMPVAACIADGLDIKGCEDSMSEGSDGFFLDPSQWIDGAAWAERLRDRYNALNNELKDLGL